VSSVNLSSSWSIVRRSIYLFSSSISFLLCLSRVHIFKSDLLGQSWLRFKVIRLIIYSIEALRMSRLPNWVNRSIMNVSWCCHEQRIVVRKTKSRSNSTLSGWSKNMTVIMSILSWHHMFMSAWELLLICVSSRELFWVFLCVDGDTLVMSGVLVIGVKRPRSIS